MVRRDKAEHITNFLSSALLVIVFFFIALLSAGLIFIFIQFNPLFLPENIAVRDLYFGTPAYIIGIILVFTLLLTVFRVKDVTTVTPTLKRLIKVLGAACALIVISNGIPALFDWVFTQFGIPSYPKGYGFIPEALHPYNALLLFVLGVILTPIFEELLFRRILIPSLVSREMAIPAAVMTSSVAFTLVHTTGWMNMGMPLYWVPIFLFTTFLSGLIFGFIYMFTRNIIFPIILHAINNTFAFAFTILYHFPNAILYLIYLLILLAIMVIGLLVWIYAFRQYRSPSPPQWVEILQERSLINTRPGFIGYIVLVVIFSLIYSLVMLFAIPFFLFGPLVPGIFLVVLTVIVIGLILYFVSKTEYIPSNP